MKKTGCAVIGYGGMGGWHTRYMLKSDVCELKGIYDINPEKSALAESNGIRAYSSREELLSDPSIELVTVATPNDSHEEIAIAAMKAGKNVISEKPVTVSLESLDRMIAVSKQTGKLFTVHQNRRWDCDYRMMKEAYRSGLMGRIFGVESRIQGSRGIPGDWRGFKNRGGGMIYDWGIHLIDQMLGIINDRKIEAVYCRCEHITNSEVDDGFKLDLFFEGGLVGHIEVGTHHFYALPRFYMTGTSGSAVINDWRDRCEVIHCTDSPEAQVKPVITAAGMTKTMAPRSEDTMKTVYIERPDSDVHDFYRNYTKAIRGEAVQYVTHAQMRRDMAVMEAAFKSDRLSRKISFQDDFGEDPIAP